MSPSSRLQKAPMSILSALELKVSGDNPTEFGGLVQPQFEVSDNYLLDRIVVGGNTTGVAAPGTSTTGTLVMPQTQRWRVRNLSAYITTAAGADAAIDKQVFVGFQDVTGFVSYFGAAESSLAFPNLMVTVPMHRPFWMAPGWAIYAFGQLASAPANAWDLVIRAVFERIIE